MKLRTAVGAVAATVSIVAVATACDPFYNGDTSRDEIGCHVRQGEIYDIAWNGTKGCHYRTIPAATCVDTLLLDPRFNPGLAQAVCYQNTWYPGEHGYI